VNHAPPQAAPSPATPRDLAPYIDHTLLAESATGDQVDRLCDEARQHRFAAVCLRVPQVARARRRLGGSGVRVAAVVDFPLGERGTAERVAEARAAVEAGAEELDLVAPLPALLAGRWEEVRRDLAAVVSAVPVPIKVILETGLLSPDQAAAGAAIARAAGAAAVKTSTGFGRGGATVEAVALLRAVVGPSLGVKASGGIRTAAQALAMLAAGASRLGTSASVDIVGGRLED
jgi:deoxyribose-phosphate aldolase